MSPIIVVLLGIMFGIFVAAIIAAVGLRSVVVDSDSIHERIRTYAALPELAPHRQARRQSTALLRLRIRLNASLSSLGSEEMALQLMSANWPVTVSEFILIRIGITLASFFLGWLFSQHPAGGVGLAVIGYLATGAYLNSAINKRRGAFAKQLVDILVLLNGSVRAGFSLLQAMEVVEREMRAPASDEFHRVQREVGLGLPLTQALENLGARMQNTDLDLVITSIKIQYQVGGNLATMLNAVTETIRERVRLFAEVRVITTQQRYTSYLLTMLPFFVAAILFFMNPTYMMRLFKPDAICMPIGALVGIALGNYFIRRIGKIDV